MSIRRSLKNVSNNYAPCERDVREATSNDKKLASAVVMARISNATYDVTQSPLVMAMLWKRLNDMGKHWRHCYKGLLLLDYLLKTGADHVVTEVEQNTFAVESLVQFQYVSPQGVDKGINVREQAKSTLSLLNNGAKLKGERENALAAHRRLTQNIGRAADPKPVPHSRASTLAKKGMVMPNGEAPPDPREAERRQVQAAQLTSAAEYDQREQFAAAISPGSQRQAISPTATEEEQLAYVLQMSALEAASPPPPAAAAARGGGDDELREQEEAELAMALSLSLADTNAGAADIIDSDDESIADSDTPPNSPYTGDLFGQGDGGRPPSYAESIDVDAASPELGSPEFGITPNHAVNSATASRSNSQPDIGGGLRASELEQYLALEETFGGQ